MLRGHRSSDRDVLADFCDGLEYSTHSLFSTSANALQLLLYYDDVEVCNPLGSSRVKHKLGMVRIILTGITGIFTYQACSIFLWQTSRQGFVPS